MESRMEGEGEVKGDGQWEGEGEGGDTYLLWIV